MCTAAATLTGLAETLAMSATRQKSKNRSRALDSEVVISSAAMLNTSLIVKKVILNTTRFDLCCCIRFLNSIDFINTMYANLSLLCVFSQ